ncbi:tRNA modification GTPase MnmE [Clostridia bacterium]|nr:tRNA modification GTPase MnmE [Clostridia bacterium]
MSEITETISETIAAFATPPGVGGVAVLRISGSDAERVLRAVFRRADGRTEWDSHVLVFGWVINSDEVIDEAMAVLMRAPRSFTREDVAEIHCHGGVAVTSRVLAAALAHGARPAQPGEFTRRAFENGRIDLAQAEAVMRLIGARGEAAARAAVRQLNGGVSKFAKDISDELIKLLAAIEAAVDFPDEVEETETAAHVADCADELAHKLIHACDSLAGRILDDGLDAVIAGPPNAGKSSLLNALLAEDRAIVHQTPGTTRDVLTAELNVAGIRVNLSDTAGLRDTDDPVELIGVERARSRLAQADLALILFDASEPIPIEYARPTAELPEGRRVILLNKSDLGIAADSTIFDTITPDAPRLSISAKTGEGLDALRELLAERASALTPESATLTSARHVESAREAAQALREAAANLRLPDLHGAALDLAAIDLRGALHSLSAITGESADEAVLDSIFSTFCVGK